MTVPPVRPVGAARGLSKGVQGIGRAAVLIGGLTIAARLLGLVRTLVFAGTVKSSCLGAAYVTANQVPNLVYDIVLGGALSVVLVPLLAGPAERSAADQDPAAAAAADQVAGRISSAALTWTVLIGIPVSAALALAAGPVISVLMPVNPGSGCSRAALEPLASSMLVVFAPQILLYGLAVVLYGILQAHRRFTGPALAPVLSSVVVMAAYVAFVPLGGEHTTHVAGLSAAAELTLSAGTTAGVAALVLTAVVPIWRLRLRLRPTIHFPPGVAARARGLAGVGIAALVAQDLSVLLVTRLANAHGSGTGGAVVLYSYGWQVFVAVYAVLAIPVALSAFPVLAALEGEEFDAAAAAATRATALTSWLGAALMAAVALPVARAFPGLTGPQVAQFGWGLAALAPGVAGYGLVACLYRVLLAAGRNRVAAGAMVLGWVIVMLADVIAVPLVPARWVVAVLGLGNTLGMSVSAIALLAAVLRFRGRAALRGVGRAAGAGLAGAVIAVAAALAVSASVRPEARLLVQAVLAAVAGVVALSVFGAVVLVLDGGDLRAVVSRFRRRSAP